SISGLHAPWQKQMALHPSTLLLRARWIFDRGEWRRFPGSPQISELAVMGVQGRMGSPNAVLGAQRAAESEAACRLSFESPGCDPSPSSPIRPTILSIPILNHNCLVAGRPTSA
ncbi:hypothetical protein CLAIMM_00196, partial [Cladophialophora immunda]